MKLLLWCKRFIALIALIVISPVLLFVKYMDFCTDDIFSLVLRKLLPLGGKAT